MRQQQANDIISVSELNRQARSMLERNLPSVWLEGEISNLAAPASGHLYFSLKDKNAQVRCAMFRGANRSLQFSPQNGMAVLIYARVTLYEARGEFQLVAEHMEAAGEGALRRQFEALKARLGAEGLFAEEHKQALPALPGSIGIVTSPSGAAVRDILHILRRRFPSIPLVIYPTPVQGAPAIKGIVSALQAADGQHDLIILARGGGSLEDLWAFNEEAVARAIFATTTPVISGVGHETDFTIADLVADVRAPTPSGAAELAVPDRSDWLRHLQQLNRRTLRSAGLVLSQFIGKLQQAEHRLSRCSPAAVLQQRALLLDDLSSRMSQNVKQNIEFNRNKINNLINLIKLNSPQRKLQREQERLRFCQSGLQAGIRQTLEQCAHRLALQGSKLHAISPLATLDRGYAIVSDTSGGKVITSIGSVKTGQTVSTRLADGEFAATVTTVTPANTAD